MVTRKGLYVPLCYYIYLKKYRFIPMQDSLGFFVKPNVWSHLSKGNLLPLTAWKTSCNIHLALAFRVRVSLLGRPLNISMS